MSTPISRTGLKRLINRCTVAAVSLLALVGIGRIIRVEAARREADGMDLAGDFPRGPLVYAQFKDLPAMLKSWDESQLKERYLKSVNFGIMQNRHLPFKLVSRWEEFNEATGGAIDSTVLGS